MRKELFTTFTMFLMIASVFAMLVPYSVSSDLHDIAVVGIIISPGISAFPGMNISLDVTVENQGTSIETFNVTAHVGNFTLQTLNVANMPPGSNITVTFDWEIFPNRTQLFPPPWDNPLQIKSKNLAVRAEAEVVPGETDNLDNVYLYGIVNISWLVPDLDGDGKIDMRDIGSVARAFGSTPGSPGWNPMVDFNSDEKIDMRDVGTSARLFGTIHSLLESPWLTVEGGNKRSDYWVIVPEDLAFEDFNVSIIIKDMDHRWDLNNATLRLGFNASVIQFHDIVFNQLWGITSHDYRPGLPGSLDEIHLTFADPSDTPDGDFILATITFNVTHQIISEGDYDDSPLDLYDTTLFEASYELPRNPEKNGLARVLYFKPSSPWLAVDPTMVIFDHYTYAVGEVFDIDLRIEGVHPGWDPKNVTLYLDFNDTVLLDMLSITFDSFWNATSYDYIPGTLGVSLGEVYMMATSKQDSIPNGDMLIATLTFNVTYQAWCPPKPVDHQDVSLLDLHGIVLFEEFQEITIGSEEDGIVIIYPFI